MPASPVCAFAGAVPLGPCALISAADGGVVVDAGFVAGSSIVGSILPCGCGAAAPAAGATPPAAGAAPAFTGAGVPALGGAGTSSGAT